MRIKGSELRRIIKEEISRAVLREAQGDQAAWSHVNRALFEMKRAIESDSRLELGPTLTGKFQKAIDSWRECKDINSSSASYVRETLERETPSTGDMLSFILCDLMYLSPSVHFGPVYSIVGAPVNPDTEIVGKMIYTAAQDGKLISMIRAALTPSMP